MSEVTEDISLVDRLLTSLPKPTVPHQNGKNHERESSLNFGIVIGNIEYELTLYSRRRHRPSTAPWPHSVLAQYFPRIDLFQIFLAGSVSGGLMLIQVV